MENFLVFKVDKDYGEIKLKEYLREYCGLSGRLIKGASREQRILVNGKATRRSYFVKKDDEIKILIEKKETQNIEPEKMDLDVIYEDKNILVVNKKPFMVVHPTKSHQNGTLSNGVIHHFRENGEDCIVRLANRLDMNTSGLVMIAKNQFVHMKLSEYMQENKIEKSYKAVVHGIPEIKSGTIDEPIGRPSLDSIKRAVIEGGQRSITHYKVEEEYKEGAILDVRLETGRTHQIRVHLSHIGNSIYGDSLYGTIDEEYINRQALHAYKLKFPHPITGEILSLQCDLPEDMKILLDTLEK